MKKHTVFTVFPTYRKPRTHIAIPRALRIKTSRRVRSLKQEIRSIMRSPKKRTPKRPCESWKIRLGVEARRVHIQAKTVYVHMYIHMHTSSIRHPLPFEELYLGLPLARPKLRAPIPPAPPGHDSRPEALAVLLKALNTTPTRSPSNQTKAQVSSIYPLLVLIWGPGGCMAGGMYWVL